MDSIHFQWIFDPWWMWTDRCGGVYGILRGFSLGGFAPQTPHQGGSAFLDHPKYGLVTPQDGDCVQDGPVTPQDGLVMPSVWGLCADLSEKRPEYVKVMEFHRFSFMRCSKRLQIVNNNVLRFLHLYPLILAFPALSCLANDRS